jgi:D-sedoheptulose 7-phosphate isomerase
VSDSARAIRELVDESIRVKQAFAAEQTDALGRAIDLVADALQGDRKILLFGNGGSAADAQHIAAEMVGRFLGERKGMPAIALTTDTSALTAIANDYGYDAVFARQIEALGRPGDVAIAISTSGKSPNVLKAVDVARGAGLKTIGLTGGDGGLLASRVDVSLCVSASRLSFRIQETHIMAGHILCELVDRRLHGMSRVVS